MNASWIGIGFSHHSVPSLSHVAMRASGGTWSGPSPVTRSTNSMIAALVGVSRHDASRSSDVADDAYVDVEAHLAAAMARD